MLLPNTSFWVFLFLWLKHTYNKEIKEGFAQGTRNNKVVEAKVGQKVEANSNVKHNTSVSEKGVDKMSQSYINTIFKLQKPSTREEASLPIYGNIGARVGRAI